MKPFIKISSLVVTPMLLLCTLYNHSGKVHIDIAADEMTKDGKVHIDIVANETTKEETHLLKTKTPQLQMMLKPLLDKVKQLQL